MKAAHLYWRAQCVYQVPTTDFADHADALEQSCQDLIGQSLLDLKTSPGPALSSGQSISAADCAEVTDMIAAVEFRSDPTDQCNFKPLLDPNTPPVVRGHEEPADVLLEGFNQGLRGWTLTNQGVFSGWPGTNWVADSSLPGGRSGTAAFAENLDGQCTSGAGDVSGVMRLESPSIRLPNGAAHSYRLRLHALHRVGARLRRRERQALDQRRRVRRRSELGVLLQPVQRDARDSGGGKHEPARRSAGVHRHRRRAGDGLVGPVVRRSVDARRQAR